MKAHERRGFLKMACAAGVGAALGPRLTRGQAPDGRAKPNIIFILADDLSSHSIGAYGGRLYRTAPPGQPEPLAETPVRTPNLDRMAREGARFDYVLSAPVCSPTRGMFLTGKYNFRIGLPDITGRGGAVKELDVVNNVTLPQLLRKHGYLTAMAGKWHLSSTGGPKMSPTIEDNPREHIAKAGFERQFQHENGLAFHNYIDKETGGFEADWIQNWVMKFLDGQGGSQRPFFLYYPMPMPHSPWGPNPKTGEKYKDAGHNGIAYFGDTVEYLDGYVGQVLDKLEELGLAENTLVLFSGDNGSEGPFTVMEDGSYTRGGKFGFGQNARVPLIARWPGTIRPGTVRDDLVDTTDFLPTLLEVAGVEPPAGGIDGVSFRDALLGKTGSPRDWMLSFWMGKYIVRDRRYGLREDGKLYDLTATSNFRDGVIEEAAMTPEVRGARDRFREVVAKYALPVGEAMPQKEENER